MVRIRQLPFAGTLPTMTELIRRPSLPHQDDLGAVPAVEEGATPGGAAAWGALTRRAFVRGGVLALAGGAAAGLLGGSARVLGAPLDPRWAAAPDPRTGEHPEDEPSEAVRKVLRQHFGERRIRTGHVELDLPESPPDGRFVPIFIESDLPMTPANYVKALHLIVDKNPDIYVAGFHFTPAVGRPSIDTRIKMRATSWVRAIAETNAGELWSATRKVFPGTNGCG